MRLIGEIPDPREAERFTAFLITLGIQAKVDRINDNKAEVWVHEEDQFKPAQAELAAFIASPSDPKYLRSVKQAQQILLHQEDKRKRIQQKISVAKRKLHPRPRVTEFLIAACVMVALFTNFGEVRDSQFIKALAFNAVPSPESARIFLESKGNRDDLNVRLASIKRGEVWRAVTPIFIHHGTMHLLFNMIWLFQLGRLIEFRYGKVFFLALIVTSAAISNTVQCVVPLSWDGVAPYLTPPPEMMLLNSFGGFSGVVYALFGFAWVKSTFDPSSRFVMPSSTVAIMLIWLIFCMLPGPNDSSLTEHLFGFRVANWAHTIGLLVGIAAGFLPASRQKSR
jgi:GlpG protein